MKIKLENIKIKIKEVYLPFLLVSIGTILFYNLLRWILDIKLGILPLKEDLLNIWMPFLIPWIPILIWLRQRTRILSLGGASDNGYFFYQFAMAAAMVVPIIVSQTYIEKSSFDLIEVESVSEIAKFEKEKYFRVNTFQVNKNYTLPYATSRTSGRHNQNLNFHLFLACPFENSDNVWYGVDYRKSLSNRISDDGKDLEYRSFIEKSQLEFDTYNFQSVMYFEKLGYSDDRDGFLEAIKNGNLHSDKKEQFILIPKSDDFNERLGNTFPWIFGSFGIGALVLLIMIIIPKVNQEELNDFRKKKPLKDDDIKFILKILDPRGNNPATAVLLLLNIVVFVVMVFAGLNIISPTPQELLEIGGNRRLEVTNGEYWRLFTSMFIHGGLMHVLMNLVGLGLGASLLEGILGKTKLIVCYLFCGILASIASICWHENTVSVGASGAIFGLYGMILAFTVYKIYPTHMRGITWVFLCLYAGVSLLFGFLGGIDNAAHFGGLIGGFVIGRILIQFEKGKLIKNAR